jgi:cellulose synthase/poly-beta-1,6-N-acetylglucosamine synthase-like glycosyltransferase
LQTLALILYLLTLAVLALYGAHRSALWLRYLRHRQEKNAPLGRFEEHSLPLVTVQLPVFNERYVVERLIEATAKLDYPTGRLEIQVLDDSTDETCALARAKCRALAEEGVDIRYLHREKRAGYKAGALQAGMEDAKGELILVFDADFVPGPQILRELVHFFTDPKVGMVQARWSHLNRESSPLTQCQAMLLDGHFVIEHAARHRSGRFFNFNGTAGIWRKSAIIDAGGWQHDTVTEDMDLSYRAQLNGWEFVYVPEVSAPAELPADMNSFRSQQFRWAKGSVQTARKLLGRISRAPIERKIKTEAFFHLTNNVAYVFLLLLALLQLPNMLIRRELEQPGILLLDIPLFLATCGSIAIFYVTAHHALHGNAWHAIKRLPLMMALGIGLAVNNSRAAIEGLFGHGVEFVRTPKRGSIGGTRARLAGSYRGQWPWHSLLEIGFGLYCGATLLTAVLTQSWLSIPFVLLFCVGFLYVGTAGLWEALQGHWAQGADAPEAATQLPSSHSSPNAQSIAS